MSNGAFVLPAGVRLSMEGDALSIHNVGDIVIEGAPAGALGTLSSERGNVVLAPPESVTLASISAPAGTVTVRGKVTTGSIVAKSVAFESGSLKVDVIKASASITLAGSKLEAHVVVAPKVTVEPSIKGRATAIQSNNELGPHKLKGGFSLAEFVDLVPNGAELLASHGVEVPEDEDDDSADDDDDDESAAAADAADEAAAELPAAASTSEATPASIREALAAIAESYTDGDLPDPVGMLQLLIEEGDIDGLKEGINGIWSALLKHHQKTDPYIPNSVTRGFQTIQLELRKM